MTSGNARKWRVNRLKRSFRAIIPGHQLVIEWGVTDGNY